MASDWIDRRDLWKNKVRLLQLRFRDRFRVAVDRHRPMLSESSYYTSAVQRFVVRIRNLSRYSSPPPSMFYKKRINKDMDASEDSVIIRMLQGLAVPVIGNACHVFMHGLNHIQIYGAEKLHQAILQRPEGKSLITVSNHVAAVDDPLVIAALVPPSVLLDAHNLRWTLCATDRCFTNPATAAFFRCVKVLPVSRGDGVYQKGMDLALSKLNKGGWVHIFPEGSRSRDGGRTLGSAKRGVGRLVMDADYVPVVLPFVHIGMEEIMPIGTHFPRIGKKVTVLIGDPIPFDDLLTMEDPQHISRGALYDAVSSRIGHRLRELKTQVDKLVLEQSLEAQNYSFWNEKCANDILHNVDWEAFGIGSYMFEEDDSSSPKQIIQAPPKVHVSHSQSPTFANRCIRMGFSHEGGIVSRIRGYMNPTEFMGFAAKGVFMNSSRNWKERRISVREAGPLKAWKEFLEANIFQQWSCT